MQCMCPIWYSSPLTLSKWMTACGASISPFSLLLLHTCPSARTLSDPSSYSPILVYSRAPKSLLLSSLILTPYVLAFIPCSLSSSPYFPVSLISSVKIYQNINVLSHLFGAWYHVCCLKITSDLITRQFLLFYLLLLHTMLLSVWDSSLLGDCICQSQSSDWSVCLPVCEKEGQREKRGDRRLVLHPQCQNKGEIRDKRGGRVRRGQVGYRKGQAVLVCLFYPVSDFLPAQDSAHSHLSSKQPGNGLWCICQKHQGSSHKDWSI